MKNDLPFISQNINWLGNLGKITPPFWAFIIPSTETEILAKPQGRWTLNGKGSCKVDRALTRSARLRITNVAGGFPFSLHTARTRVAARGTRALPGVCGPAPRARPVLDGPSHAHGRLDFRTPSPAAGPLPASEALPRTKGGRRASQPPSHSAVSAPARPARRALPTSRRGERQAFPRRRPEGHRRPRVAEVWAPTLRGHEPILHLLSFGP